MNEQLQKQLTNLLTWAEQATSTTANFVAEQTPLYITELLQYNFWMSLIYFSLFLSLILGSIVLISIFVKWMSKEDDWELSPTLMFFLIPVVIGCFGASQNMDWLKIKLAPRVYIVDYLRSEIKK
jgi:hypothetical protein